MSDNISSAKRELRKHILGLRMGLGDAEVQDLSGKIQTNLFASTILKDIKTAFIYKSFKNEADTAETIGLMRECGIRTCFPRVEAADTGQRVMAIYEAPGGDEFFEMGNFGILEPCPKKCAPVKIEEIDLVVVPGVAYDKGFFRLGFGGGFYDRFLANVKPSCIKAAPAFELQIVSEVPRDIFDMPVDCIITEEQVYYDEEQSKKFEK